MTVNWTIIGSLLVALIAYIISPHLSYKRELKRMYDVPFQRDMAFFYGEALEFYKRYIKPLAENQTLNVSDVQIIDDFRSLHKSQEEFPKWLGKIEKELRPWWCRLLREPLRKQDKEVVNGIWNILDVVDRLYHNMESESEFRIKKPFSSREDILEIDPAEREKMAERLINQLKDEKERLKNTGEVLKHLGQKIH